MLSSFQTPHLLKENSGCVHLLWVPSLPTAIPHNADQMHRCWLWQSLILDSTNLEPRHMRGGHFIVPDGGKKFRYFERLTQCHSPGGWQDVKVRYWKIRFMLLCQWGECKLPVWQRRWCVVWTSRKRKSATQIKNYPVGHPKMILTSA